MSTGTKVFGIGIVAIILVVVSGLFLHNPRTAAGNAAARQQVVEQTAKVTAPAPFMQPGQDGGLGAPPPLSVYTEAQLKEIGPLYRGGLDGAKRFQAHCGKADVTYVRSTGPWSGATTLMYSSGRNRAIRDDVSVIIAKRDELPQWMGDMYAEGARDGSRYALQVYLATSGIEKVPLDPGRAVVLLGCKP